MATRKKKAADAPPKPVVTLAVDIGGTGIKTMMLDEAGKPLGERLRDETPHPALPEAIVEIIGRQAQQHVAQHGEFDRVSVGFPGVVHNGVVSTAPNLGKEWAGFDLDTALTKTLGKPTRVLNDADVQGYAAIEREGVELVITLGTGMGSGLYVNGKLVPNLELAHHPYRKGRTYEEMLGNATLQKIGRKRWNRRVHRAIQQLDATFNYKTLFIGGGNSKKVEGQLPPNVKIIDNTAGLLGGIALWRDVAESDIESKSQASAAQA
jgi:polyphosphate glucokinase